MRRQEREHEGVSGRRNVAKEGRQQGVKTWTLF